jgi:hypothetical protein
MSTIELAVKKVKKLSDSQVRELLSWLDKRQPKASALKSSSKRPARRKAKTYPSMRELLAWYDSVRLTTDWEPPRMPPDLVKPVQL